MELDYQVYDQDYQGPLEGLLEVARSKDVVLSRINLSELIDDFVNHLENSIDWEVKEVSTALLIFSELLRIKSRDLVPRPETDEEETEQTTVPGEDKEKDFFVEVGKELRDRAEERSKLYETNPDLPEFVREGETVYKEVTLFELIKAFQDIMVTTQESDSLPELQYTDEFDTEEQMDKILKTVQPQGPTPFEQLLNESPKREEIVVTFVALLQLVKSGELRIVKKVDTEQIYVISPGGD